MQRPRDALDQPGDVVLVVEIDGNSPLAERDHPWVVV